MLVQSLPCYGVSFYVPGEGACAVGCRLAEDCRAAYLTRAVELAAESPAALAEDERRFVLEHSAPPAAPDPARRVEPGRSRRRPTRWTDDKRRPLHAAQPSSIAALAAEVLRAAERPMHVRAVTSEVMQLAADRGVSLGGKTPAATVGLALRQLLEVKQVGRGMYAWSGAASDAEAAVDQIGRALGGAA